MARLGFGLGGTRHTTGGTPNALVQQITASGVTFNFAASRPAGRYANGDWWVLGPVTITAITPASTTMDGTRADGSSYTGRAIHGTMVNPGNRGFATGGLTANNVGVGANGVASAQGMDSFSGTLPVAPYNAIFNVDPGRTGSPLVVTTGTVVKCLSATQPAQLSAFGRQAPLFFVPLTVVDSIPASDAIRPGMSGSSKISPARASDIDLSVFQNLTPVTDAPSFATALSYVAATFGTFYLDSSGTANMLPQAAGPEYGRDIAKRVHDTLLCLHLNSFSADQKRALMIHILTLAGDLASRAEEGGLSLGNGGWNQWMKSALVVATAALKAKAPASWVTVCDGTRIPNPMDRRQVWGEDAQFSAITDFDIALPRKSNDGRPRTPFSYMTLGSVDWGNWVNRDDAGMNWDTLFYRLIFSPALLPGIQAVEMTTGGVALWNNPQPFIYMKTAWHRRSSPAPDTTNDMTTFARNFMNAYRFVDPAAPQIVVAQVKDNNWFVRFDKALDELVTAPGVGDFMVLVNGSPVAVSTLQVWRTAVGGTLASTIANGTDTVTISYTPGANPLRSVDGVNVASFTNRAATNRTDKVGGPNAAYPVVRFDSGAVRQMGGTQRIHTVNSQVGTFALLGFKFDAAPTLITTLFGHASGTGPILVQINPGRILDIRIQNASNTTILRLSVTLTAGVKYDILLSIDMTQAIGANAFQLYVNGSSITGTPAAYVPGSTIGWSTANGAIRFNHNGTFGGEIGAVWLDATTRVDLSNPANRAKFNSLTAGNLDILTRGDGITGSIPQVFLVGNDAQWNDAAGINRGAGNKFFVSSTGPGPFSQVSGSEWA